MLAFFSLLQMKYCLNLAHTCEIRPLTLTHIFNSYCFPLEMILLYCLGWFSLLVRVILLPQPLK